MADNIGLITKHTDLTSLKYGTLPLGSKAPYVTKDINNPPSSNSIAMEITKRIDDVSRISQMLVDKPGLKYFLHEAELNQAKIASDIKKARAGGKSIAGAVLKGIGGELLRDAKIIGSTLAQVAVNGTGTHFVKGFGTDTYLMNNASGSINGGQLSLEGITIPITNPSTDYEFTPSIGPRTPNTWGRDLKDEYRNKYVPYVEDQYSPTYQYLNTKKEIAVTGSIFIGGVNASISGSRNVTKEVRINLGDQGARSDNSKIGNNYWSQTTSVDYTNDKFAPEMDQINAINLKNKKVVGEVEGRDLIKFRFHILVPNQPETILYFRAFLDSFDDNFTGQWNQVKYLGRAEDFQIYNGFQRKIGIGFKIAAATRAEMKPLYQKMVMLASATAPTYGGTDGQFMRGTLIKVTVGDYIYELPGTLNNISFTWNPDYPWEIAMLEPENQNDDNQMQELPMVLDCKVDFTPIHNFTPKTGILNSSGSLQLNNFFTSKNQLKQKSFWDLPDNTAI